MTVECAVIAGIIGVISLIFWRRHHIMWMWATLPLMLVPLSYLVTYGLVGHIMKISVTDIAAIVVLIAAVGISCVWLGLVSNNFKSRKTRVTYIGIANAFNVALAAILSVNILTA